MPETFEGNYDDYIEANSESKKEEIDAAINHTKSDLDSFQSEVFGSGFNSINEFYRLEGDDLVYQLNKVRNYLASVCQRLQGMKKQKFGEVSKENNFKGTILAIKIALKAMETDSENPKKYNIGKINGEYDEATIQAIKQFQTDNNLMWNDGKPGKETIGKLLEKFDKLIDKKKEEVNEQKKLKSDITDIIEESYRLSIYGSLGKTYEQEGIINYIIEGNLGTGKNTDIEAAISDLAEQNYVMNWKLQYLIEHSKEPLKDSIAQIKDEENKRRGRVNNQISGVQEIIKKGNDKYTFGRNLTETQKDTITNILSGWRSPVTAKMVADSCQNFENVPVEYLLAFMQNDSRVGTAGRGARTHNPGNVGNTERSTKNWGTREKGVDACAENLQKRIDTYLKAKDQHNGKGFNDFPTPEELATGKSKGGFKFFGIYMSASDGPRKVAGMVKTWTNRLKGE